MKTLLVVTLALFIVGCASAPITNGGNVYRPTLSDNPVSYLKGFSLGAIAKDDILEKVGVPDKTATSGDREFLTYNIGDKQGHGIIEYTYIIKDGKVSDVRYVNSGNFFGVQQHESARELQK